MTEVHVVGVRHHSPACARLVAHVVREVRPRFVLVEGPSDMNERMGELVLGHELPIAIFSYAQGPALRRASWSPFCAYSPEWVAIEEARAAGGEALFIDLPSWDSAFAEVQNRYSDRHSRASDRMRALATRLGFEDTDSLWDHLFEQPLDLALLRTRLNTYFRELREGDDAGDRDRAREAYMARWIAWAAATQEGDVVVVCGGYHAPELERAWRDANASRPEVSTLDAETRTGSYLVPYSFHRLDAFVGYEAGMPSPEFHQRVWELGANAAGEAMLFEAIAHLRKKKQRVSPADAIAALTLARGLRLVRGHAELARVDVLDGLAAAIVKDALDAPLPWNRRGSLASGTDPMLVEMVAAFSGERVGKLAKGTPLPPLVGDALGELARARVDLPTRVAGKVVVALTEPEGLTRSRVLHRLRVLGVPGIILTRAPSLTRDATDLGEEWSVVRAIEFEPALIEAAAYGATLESAAAAKLEEAIARTNQIGNLAKWLGEAALVGIDSVTMRLVAEVRRIAAVEPSFGELGAAIGQLLALYKHDVLLGAAGAPILGEAIEAAFVRGLWLLEGIDGAAGAGEVNAVLALRDALRHGGARLALDAARAEAVMSRRAADTSAPPPIRGAAMGFLWSTRAKIDEEVIARAVKSAGRPETLGDFLTGLFALAREEVVHAPSLLAVIDGLVEPMTRDDFMIAIPSLRLAFSYFPPREKESVAKHVLSLRGRSATSVSDLTRLSVDAAITMRGMQIDKATDELARRFALDDDARSR